MASAIGMKQRPRAKLSLPLKGTIGGISESDSGPAQRSPGRVTTRHVDLVWRTQILAGLVRTGEYSR